VFQHGMVCSSLMLSAIPSAIEKATRRPIVLVVEDEILIRSPVAEFLRAAGYKIVEAANAAEAVAVFVTGTVIDLVFSDLDMPGPMDGVGLALWISHHHPGVHVILTSGIRNAARAGEIPAVFLSKPYRLAEVARCIGSLLEEPQRGNA
jgi:DNA-binding NtrC family response regulator